MPSRDVPFADKELYHCFNRGVDKRIVFLDAEDFHYFLTALELFNQKASLGDMRHYKQMRYDDSSLSEPLVSILAYCLNPNHFHILLQQETEGGITEFMRKLGTGYTMYFNKKYNRSGSLFQGQFKSVHVNSNIQLKHLFAYVTKNNLVHKIKDSKKYKSSYIDVVEKNRSTICNIQLIHTLIEGNLANLVASGIDYTIAYRSSLENSKKSEFLE